MRTFNAQQAAIVASLVKTEISWLFEVDKDGDGDVDYYWSTKAKTWGAQAYTFAVTEFSPIKMERNRSEYGINAPPAFDFTITNKGTTLYPSDFTGGNVAVKLVVKSLVRKATVTVTGGTKPAAGETMTGATSGATAVLVSAPDAWTGDVACYFVSQSKAFHDDGEVVNFTGGGAGTIAVDLTYAAEEAEIASWGFDFISVAPKYQTLQFDCQSWIEKYLTGVYPNTQTLDSLWPSDQNDYTGCVPLIFGTCYIPVHTAFITDDRYYVLGPAAPTYTITKSRSPIEVSTVSEWTPANYAFNQYTKAGGDSANYKVFQLIGTTVTEDPTGNILYKLWNALTGANAGSDTVITNYNPGAGYLSLPTKYSRDDTVALTAPTDVIHYILEDFGIPSARIDDTSRATVAATIAGWGLTWNVGLFNQDDRKTLLSSLLQQCHVELIIRDKVYFKVHAKASQRTITASDVIDGSFDYRVNKKEISDCGYVLYPDPSGDVPVSKLTKTLVPATTTTASKSSIEVDCQFVSSGSIHAQVLGSLSLQRQLLPEADVSLNAKGFLLALEPDDFVTMSGDNYGAGTGKTYSFLIDSMSIAKDLEISVSGTKYSAALSDFEDPSPSAVVVGTDSSSNAYQVMYAGPEATGAAVDPTIFNGVMKASTNVGMSGLVSGGVDWRIWAGAAFADRATATFRVDDDGNTYCSSLHATGEISGSYIYGSSLMTKGTYLAATCAAADATLNVGDTTDFPVSGTAWFIDSANDRDAFTYTGKTATTLTGCSGVLAHTVSAANKPLVVPSVKGMYINDAVNEMRFFGDRGDGTVEELVNIGIKTRGDEIIGYFGSADSSRIAVYGISNFLYGLYGKSVSNYSVYSDGTTYLGGNTTITTGSFLGLGAAKGRITFTDAATDDIAFADCTVTLPNTGLHILDTDSSHDLIVVPGSNLSADRILTITTGDAARTLTFTADASIGGTNTGDVTVSAPVAVTGQALSLVNDAAATVTEIDTGALANSDTVIPTSKAVTTAIAAQGEGHITIMPFSYSGITQGTWEFSYNTNQYLCSVVYNSSGANGDRIDYTAFLAAGTYKFVFFGYQTAGNCGILDFLIDGTSKGTADLYSAGVVYNTIKTIADIVVTAAGVKTLSIKASGKNASSSGYYIIMGYFALYRTA